VSTEPVMPTSGCRELPVEELPRRARPLPTHEEMVLEDRCRRDRCTRCCAPTANGSGHALAQRDHDPDLWVAPSAVRLGVPLVSNDGIFQGVPGLAVETA